jgi:hypothetical protein
MKYRIYIDEVGNPDLENSDNPNHRFLSLTGIIIESEHVANIIHPEMEELKHRFFRTHPDEPLILHRKEIVNAKPPFESLEDEKKREQFNRELLRLLLRWEYVVITVCLDKRHHKETYTSWRFDPYHYCLAMLLERYALFLKRNGSIGDAMAESRGGKEDRRLKDSYERLWQVGTEYIAGALFQEVISSRQLKVKPKLNNIAGLQLADLIAHPSRNEILRENDLMLDTKDNFGRRICAILGNKYDQIEGKIYGKKFI